MPFVPEEDGLQEMDSSNSSEFSEIVLINEDLNNSTKETCWPHIPLDRISLPTNLAFEYNLPSEDDDVYPFILNISNSGFTYTRFEVLPIVDIGGTLVIELAVSPFMVFFILFY